MASFCESPCVPTFSLCLYPSCVSLSLSSVFSPSSVFLCVSLRYSSQDHFRKRPRQSSRSHSRSPVRRYHSPDYRRRRSRSPFQRRRSPSPRYHRRHSPPPRRRGPPISHSPSPRRNSPIRSPIRVSPRRGAPYRTSPHRMDKNLMANRRQSSPRRKTTPSPPPHQRHASYGSTSESDSTPSPSPDLSSLGSLTSPDLSEPTPRKGQRSPSQKDQNLPQNSRKKRLMSLPTSDSDSDSDSVSPSPPSPKRGRPSNRTKSSRQNRLSPTKVHGRKPQHSPSSSPGSSMESWSESSSPAPVLKSSHCRPSSDGYSPQRRRPHKEPDKQVRHS